MTKHQTIGLLKTLVFVAIFHGAIAVYFGERFNPPKAAAILAFTTGIYLLAYGDAKDDSDY